MSTPYHSGEREKERNIHLKVKILEMPFESFAFTLAIKILMCKRLFGGVN